MFFCLFLLLLFSMLVRFVSRVDLFVFDVLSSSICLFGLIVNEMLVIVGCFWLVYC